MGVGRVGERSGGKLGKLGSWEGSGRKLGGEVGIWEGRGGRELGEGEV